jgi:hypothetical protein
VSYTYKSLVPQEQVDRAINLALAALNHARFRWENRNILIVEASKALQNVIDGIVDPVPPALRDLFRLLPFATSIQYGNTYRHIVNESCFTVKTAQHEIHCHEPLCARSRYGLKDPGATTDHGFDDCPGCLAKGRALAAEASK